jgi:hypothetical protein
LSANTRAGLKATPRKSTKIQAIRFPRLFKARCLTVAPGGGKEYVVNKANYARFASALAPLVALNKVTI